MNGTWPLNRAFARQAGPKGNVDETPPLLHIGCRGRKPCAYRMRLGLLFRGQLWRRELLRWLLRRLLRPGVVWLLGSRQLLLLLNQRVGSVHPRRHAAF